MKATLVIPNPPLLDKLLQAKQGLSPSYLEKGNTHKDFEQLRTSSLSRKFDFDDNRILLGETPVVFEKAKEVISSWQMFPRGWTSIYPENAPIQADQQVVVIFHHMGLRWLNVNKIIYTIDEPKRFGFAYGTMPGHVECGEELFLLEIDEAGRVWYRIKAFSRPAHWLIKLAYPYARRMQRRFVKTSMQQVFDLVHSL